MDALQGYLEAWRGRVIAPHEGVRVGVDSLPAGQEVAQEASAPLTADRRRPFAATAFGGTSAAAAAALLHLWQLGYAPAPLDMRLLTDDLAYRLQLVRPRRILTDRSHAAVAERAASAAGLDRIDVAVLDDNPTTWPELLPKRAASAEDAGMIVFTSGTTALPKAVLLSRLNLVACAEQVAAAQRLKAEDRVLNPLSLAHVNAPVIALLATVISGGDVVLAKHFDPRQFWSLASEHRITWANLVPPLIAMLARHPSAAARAEHTLRFVRSASAPLPVQTMHEFEQAFNVPVVESYGISEAASQVTINDVPPGERLPGSVGRARGVEVRIVDDDGNPLPPGISGEVVVSGPTVMQGYLGDESATAEAIRGGWLHTGDLGVLDSSGHLTLVGRRKELINRGGEKIAPRLVEEVLLGHPAVADAAVVGVPDPIYGEEVKAYVVQQPGAGATTRELLQFAASKLPVHARPRSIEFIGTIPRNPSGKIVRRELMAS